MTETLHCNSMDELDGIAVKLLHKYPNARIFAFFGAMGAGKTTFIKKVCRQLGVKDEVNSPTFAIINEYIRENRESVFHFDLYRLKSWQELLDIGYEDYFYSGKFCFIEWPEKIENLLPEDAINVAISVSNESFTRSFTF
jgi:tRNA threonylcarbamoyladenosine biosynthesis protein TsaE